MSVGLYDQFTKWCEGYGGAKQGGIIHCFL